VTVPPGAIDDGEADSVGVGSAVVENEPSAE
jgi:hypothetical protein